MNQPQRSSSAPFHRRQLLQAAGGAAAAGVWTALFAAQVRAEKAVVRGRIRQSVAPWCFADYWNLEQLCQIAKELGCQSIELLEPDQFATVKKYGLTCAISNSHLYVQGMNNPRYQPGCIEMLRQRIDQCVEAGFPTVITFTGYAEESGEWNNGANPDLSKLPSGRRVIDPDEGLKNCVAGFKKIVGYAEQKKINLIMEVLNSRVDVEMKGHPDYMGDSVEWCVEACKQVGSERLKILFDIYHVQIMQGDIITRIKQFADYIGHYHTAGNPGRNELDDNQEINYPPIMRAIVETGYQGFVAQEFIPTRDPATSLREAVSLCDV